MDTSLHDLKKAIQDKYGEKYEIKIEVLDVLDNWEQAKTIGIKVTPTLLKTYPLPIVKIAGGLLNLEEIIKLLQL